jgi:hypothetical protein
VLASQPELLFLSSALGLSGFQDSLPSPDIGLTIFAPTNSAFFKLLDQLGAQRSSKSCTLLAALCALLKLAASHAMLACFQRLQFTSPCS